MKNAEVSMDVSRLEVILCESTAMLRDDEQPGHGYEVVDCFLKKVGVLKEKAQEFKGELAQLMQEYPLPNRLAVGPSYIELAGTIFNDDQDLAFRLMALGKTTGLWDLLTPRELGIGAEDAKRLASHGVVTIDGYGGKK